MNDVPQVLDVSFEGASPAACQRYTCTRLLAYKRFLNLDIAGILERGEVGTQVAVRDTEQLAQFDELELCRAMQRVERGHDLQTSGLVNQLIHRRRNHSPPAISAPPETHPI